MPALYVCLICLPHRYWESGMADGRIVLTNSDDESLYLAADGSFTWLWHPGINRAVIIADGVCSTSDRAQGTAALATREQ